MQIIIKGLIKLAVVTGRGYDEWWIITNARTGAVVCGSFDQITIYIYINKQYN